MALQYQSFSMLTSPPQKLRLCLHSILNFDFNGGKLNQSRKTQQHRRQSSLVVLDHLALALVNLVVPVPEPGVERLDHGQDFLAQRRPDLLLHVQTLVPRDHLVEARIERLELLLLLVLVLAAQALNDGGAVDGGAGDGPVGRGRRVGLGVDLVKEVDRDLLPSVHVQRRGPFAPLLELGRVGRDTQVHGEVGGGADGAVEEGDAVGEEAALEGLGAVDGLCFGVEGGEQGLDDVDEVVGEQGRVFGFRADGEEGGIGGVGERELGRGAPVAVADGGEEGGDRP